MRVAIHQPSCKSSEPFIRLSMSLCNQAENTTTRPLVGPHRTVAWKTSATMSAGSSFPANCEKSPSRALTRWPRVFGRLQVDGYYLHRLKWRHP